MTVQTTTRVASFLGNGVATVFPFNFPVYEPAHMDVRLYTVATGQYVQLTGADYIATGIGEDSTGGTVTYNPPGGPINSTQMISIYRTVPYTQDTNIYNQDGFYPEILEMQLDLIVMQIQQIFEQLQRSLVFPPTTQPLTYEQLVELRDQAVAAATASGVSAGEAAQAALDAQAAAAEAADYAALAANNFVTNTFITDGIETVFELSAVPNSVSNLFINVEGVFQFLSTVESLVGTTLTLTEPPPAGNMEIRFGYTVTPIVPSVESITAAMLKTSELPAIRTRLDVYTTEETDDAIDAAVVAATGIDGRVWGLALSNNGTDATNDIDIGAGVAASDDGTTLMRIAAGITKQLDVAWAVGTNAGMRDTGSIADGTWHIWEIHNPTAVITDILASLSATAPTMPTNYTKKRYIGQIIRESGAIVGFVQSGMASERIYLRKAVSTDVNGASSSGTSAVLRTLKIPGGRKVRAIFSFALTSTGGENVLITSPDQTDVAASGTNNTFNVGSSGRQSGMCEFLSNTASQIRTRQAVGSSGEFMYITTHGWKDSI